MGQNSPMEMSEAVLRGKAYGVTWELDSAVNSCQSCPASFDLLTRKHHCRFCGKIFCSQCASSEMKHLLSLKPERACSGCIARQHRLALPSTRSLSRSNPASWAPPVRSFEEQMAMAQRASLQQHQEDQEQHQFEQALEAARQESVELAMKREADTEVLSSKLAEIGLKEVLVPRDGNCQFHAIVDALEGITQQSLRQQLVDWLESQSEYQLAEGDADTALAHYLDMDSDWNTFCTRMRCEGQYGDHLTLIAAAECTASSIVVITSQAEGVNYHVQPRGVTPMRTIYLVHYPMQLHFNLAVERNDIGEGCTNDWMSMSIDLSEHLCASFTFVLSFPGEGTESCERRAVSTFHPETGKLSVGMEDLRTWVASVCRCALSQVSLQWEDEEQDLIDFDTEKELSAAVESLAARSTRTLRVSVLIKTELDGSNGQGSPMSHSGVMNQSGSSWVLVDSLEESELSTPYGVNLQREEQHENPM